MTIRASRLYVLYPQISDGVPHGLNMFPQLNGGIVLVSLLEGTYPQIESHGEIYFSIFSPPSERGSEKRWGDASELRHDSPAGRPKIITNMFSGICHLLELRWDLQRCMWYLPADHSAAMCRQLGSWQLGFERGQLWSGEANSLRGGARWGEGHWWPRSSNAPSQPYLLGSAQGRSVSLCLGSCSFECHFKDLLDSRKNIKFSFWNIRFSQLIVVEISKWNVEFLLGASLIIVNKYI